MPDTTMAAPSPCIMTYTAVQWQPRRDDDTLPQTPYTLHTQAAATHSDGFAS